MWKGRFLSIIMLSEDTKILDLNEHWKSNKAPICLWLKEQIDVKIILESHPQRSGWIYTF